MQEIHTLGLVLHNNIRSNPKSSLLMCPVILLFLLQCLCFGCQMLRKSVETRDCLSSIEPRNVRAVMKRVIEDVTGIDSQVGQLYEEGTRTERTSDSTRRSYTYSSQRQAPRSQW